MLTWEDDHFFRTDVGVPSGRLFNSLADAADDTIS